MCFVYKGGDWFISVFRNFYIGLFLKLVMEWRKINPREGIGVCFDENLKSITNFLRKGYVIGNNTDLASFLMNKFEDGYELPLHVFSSSYVVSSQGDDKKYVFVHSDIDNSFSKDFSILARGVGHVPLEERVDELIERDGEMFGERRVVWVVSDEEVKEYKAEFPNANRGVSKEDALSFPALVPFFGSEDVAVEFLDKMYVEESVPLGQLAHCIPNVGFLSFHDYGDGGYRLNVKGLVNETYKVYLNSIDSKGFKFPVSKVFE